MLEWRLKAYRRWLEMEEPDWAHVGYPKIDYNSISYYSAPKRKEDMPQSLDEVDPELLKTYEKLGIPLHEREKLAGVAVDAVFDSVSVATTFKEPLAKAGVIFCSISEAIRDYPELVQKYLGSVVPMATTSSPGSTQRSSLTAPSFTCPKAFAALWSCPPISASTRPTPVSSSAP